MTGDRQTEADGGIATGDDVYTSEKMGEQYRDTVYEGVNYGSLETASTSEAYPETGRLERFKEHDLPKVPKLSHIVGPSAIMLGASLGSGETQFWPTLIAQNGWSLYWAFWVGVLTQFVINTELQRWTLATGESIFRAFDRVHSFWPWFFLAAGFFHLGWPGWAAGAAKVLGAWAGLGTGSSVWPVIGVLSMVAIWLSYQAGPVMYNAIEKIQLGLMILAIGGSIVLIFVVGSVGELTNVPAGAVSFGTLPTNMNIAVFLGGLAYAGAGGYINLSQGVWAREKGFGMGTYQGRVKNPLRGGTSEEVHDGFAFEPNDRNFRRWKAWWNVTQKEQFLTFVVGLLVVATVAMTIAAEYAAGTEVGAIDMWLTEIIPQFSGAIAFLLYAVIWIALFSTQYAIVESFVRNSVDILFQGYGRTHGWDVSRVFLGLLTIFTIWGIVIIGANYFIEVTQPWLLLVIGAAIAGAMMWPYNALTTIVNTTRLPEHTQPGWARTVAMWWATGFFGYFTVLLIGSVMTTPEEYGFEIPAFETTIGIVGSGVGGYVLWVVFFVVQIYVMYRSGKAKIEASGTVEGAEKAKGIFS
ncbi:Nramp family divalent metal transporter [Haladaptatus sp. NG-WS-4]